MAEVSKPSSKLKVFVSYSREDLSFADQLVAALDAYGFATTIDRKGIHGAEKWEERLGQMILEADTIVFVLSPDSAASDACKWEVDQAIKFGKRVVPLLWRPLGTEKPHPHLQDLNYIFFYEEPSVPDSGFGSGLARLVDALAVDVDWVREHTRLSEMAMRWETAGRSADRLVRGSEVSHYKTWRERRPTNAPELTDLQRNFLAASEDAETQRIEEQRRQIDEIQSAQVAREKALATAEKAQKDREVEQRRRHKLQRIFVVGAVAVAIGVAMLYSTFAQRVAAVQAQHKAEIAVRKLSTKVFEPCLDSIEATVMLATTQDTSLWSKASEAFWKLYLGPMIRLENEERERLGGRSQIAERMIKFGEKIPGKGQPAPNRLPLGQELVKIAESVKTACAEYLKKGISN